MFIPGIRVSASADSFRRAGFIFGRAAVVLAADMVSAEQLSALLSEPKLTVSFSEGGEHWFVPTPEQVAEFEVALAAGQFQVDALHNEAALLAKELGGPVHIVDENGDLLPPVGGEQATEFQTPGGPEDGAEGDASPAAPAEGQVADDADDTVAAAVDPAGAAPVSTAGAEELREEAVVVSVPESGAAVVAEQPAEAPQPPVVDPTPSGRRKGKARASAPGGG